MGKTVAEILKGYWGEAQWEKIKDLAIENEIDLEQLVDAEIPAWSDIEDSARKAMHDSSSQLVAIQRRYGWRTPVNSEDLTRSGFSVVRDLTSVELVEVDRLARTWEPALCSAIRDYEDDWASVLDDLWQSGNYSKAPLFLPASDPNDSTPTLASGSLAVQGWAIAYRIPTADYPEIVERRKELDELASERRKIVQEYLDAL